MNRILEKTSVHMHQPQLQKDNDFLMSHLLSAGQQMHSYLALQKPSCTNNAMEFAYSQSSAIGLFSGVEVHQHGITTDVLKKFLEHVRGNSISKTTVIQVSTASSLINLSLTLYSHSYVERMALVQTIASASLPRALRTCLSSRR